MRVRDHYLSHDVADLVIGFTAAEVALICAGLFVFALLRAEWAYAYLLAHIAPVSGLGAYRVLFHGSSSRERAKRAAQAGD